MADTTPPAPKPVAKPATRKVRLVVALIHDGETFAPGAEVTLPADLADTLLDRHGAAKA
jgi:hypothetical protein